MKQIDFHERENGELTFSYGQARIADTRVKSKDGRIQRVLGTEGPFSESFKDAVLSDYEGILERKYLEKELKCYKRVIQTLRKSTEHPDVARLLKKIDSDPTKFRGENILCPFWKSRRIQQLTRAAIPRYLFPEKSGELYLLTLICNFATNLEELEAQIKGEHQRLDKVLKILTGKKRGLFIAGCLEPDLKSWKELLKPNSNNAKMLKDWGVEIPDTGGWILTVHCLVRVSCKEMLKTELEHLYPSFGYIRIRFDELKHNKSLALHMMDILDYGAKYPDPLFRFPTKGREKTAGDELMRAMHSAFYGPKLPDFDPSSFDVEAAIRQWALFMDRMGERYMYYCKESTYAQKWYSQSEWWCIRENDDDVTYRGQKTEPHRDTEFDSDRSKFKDKKRCRKLKTRNLRYDPDWIELTYMGTGPFVGVPYTYDRWMLSWP